MDVGDEGAVDLDLVGGDVGQRRQRRIADAEIVDRDPDAELAEDRQDLVLEMRLGDEGVFRHLDHEALGKSGRLERLRERAHEFGIAGLLGRDVDADRGVVAEGLVDQVDRLDDLRQHQMGQLVDQAEFDGEIDEGAGGLNHALVVAQAHQRLDALDLLGPDVDLGLEGAAEALFQDGEPQRLLDLHPRQRLALHAGVEERRGALAVVLDAVHRDVGVLAQRVVAAAMVGIEADADRGRGEYLRSVDEERRLQPLQHEAGCIPRPRARSGSG